MRKILDYIGVDFQAPRITQAPGPPLWDDCDAQVRDGVDGEPEWDVSAQTAPDQEVDQRTQTCQPDIPARNRGFSCF